MWGERKAIREGRGTGERNELGEHNGETRRSKRVGGGEKEEKGVEEKEEV